MLKPTYRAIFFLLLPVSGVSHATPADVSFSRDVRPILSDRCFKCHGPDPTSRKAKLRLDIPEGVQRVITRKSPQKSELLLRIAHSDPEERMPPPASKLSLTTREIEVLKAWVLAGAPYEQHWAFVPVSTIPIPAVRQKDWPRNPIDHFVLARLEAEGLTPSAPAPIEKLARRASFDLTGLPPTLRDLDELLAAEHDNAYDSYIDRLFKSSAYGERMTADWLDVARYSDTYGYQVDRDRHVWPWRDWVIKAFDRNMPYDRFVTEQLAGDLLPNATDDQILATTFNRLHPQKVEGGSVPEEFRVEYVADRNHTFATAFLGLTLECARCHEHKYDPISQKEYYQLFAFFNNIDECGLYSYFTSSVPTPTLLMADTKTKERIAATEKKIADAERALSELADRRRGAFAEWLKQRGELKDNTLPGRVAYLHFENHKGGANKSVRGKVGKAVELSGDDGIGVGKGNFRRYEPFSVSLWMKTPDHKERAVVFHRSRAWTDAGSRGYQLLLEDGRLSASLIHFWPGNAIRVRGVQPVRVGEWVHVVVTYDGSSRADGLRIFVDGELARTEVVQDSLYKNITGGGGDNIRIGERFRDRGFTGGQIDEFKVFSRELTAIETRHLAGQSVLTDLLRPSTAALKNGGGRAETPERVRDLLFPFFLHTVDEPYRKSLATVRAAREERSKTVDGIREIMVMKERSTRRPTYVLKRGAYDAPTVAVEPQTPAVFPPLPKGATRNRLGLARWLTDPSHPLTSRVAVNRLWRLCFGHGLVRTPEDFGSQGAQPTHPELLDWLAKDFVEHGWDVQRTLKLIVTSATYRQSSDVSEALRARDPDNLLLARAPRYRLPAEMIRDNALSVSRLLTRTVGGPPARPYDLKVSFKPINPDKGAGLYRRSVYTFWKRTAPAPVMMALDASKRDVCRVKRERTSSPLQALVLLNGPQFVEAARLIGRRFLTENRDDADAMIQAMFRALTSRAPMEREKAVLRRLYDEQVAFFAADQAGAEKFLSTGHAPRNKALPVEKLAAATVLASALLNFDECVMKR